MAAVAKGRAPRFVLEASRQFVGWTLLGALLCALSVGCGATPDASHPVAGSNPDPRSPSGAARASPSDDTADDRAVEVAPANSPLLWSLPAALTNRHGHRVERIADTLYVFGGYVGGRATAELFSFDLRTGRSKPLAPMLHPRAFFGSTVIDGALYVVGDGAERYLPNEDRWEFVAGPGSFPRSHFATAAVGAVLCTLGGFPEERGHFTAFDTATSRRWHPASPPDFDPGDHFHFMTGTPQGLHVVGGYDHAKYDGETAHWHWDGEKWTARAPLPTGDAAKFGTEAHVRRSWYVFGMYGAHRYDFATNSWTPLPTFPTSRAMSASAAYRRSLIVIGGKTAGAEPAVLTFDLDAERWISR